MDEYMERAEKFLQETNSTMKIEFAGTAINDDWDEKNPRNRYSVTLTTPKGSMQIDFWDSLYNTNRYNMTLDDYARKKYGRYFNGLDVLERNTVYSGLKRQKDASKPSTYDILACLTKYDPGIFEDFCSDYGYSNDSIKAMKTYFAVQNEYARLSKLFTSEQMEKLREIE